MLPLNEAEQAWVASLLAEGERLGMAASPESLQDFFSGIFTVPVFNADVGLNAEFPAFRFSQFNIPEKDIRWKDTVLILGIENKKSFTAQPALQLNGRELEIALSDPNDASPFGSAVYYTVNEAAVKSGFSLKGSLSIQGGKSLKIVPLAQDNVFDLRSTWPSPARR